MEKKTDNIKLCKITKQMYCLCKFTYCCVNCKVTQHSEFCTYIHTIAKSIPRNKDKRIQNKPDNKSLAAHKINKMCKCPVNDNCLKK